MKLFPKLAFATALSGVLVGAGASLWGAPTDAPTTEAGAIRAAILDDFRAAEHAQAVARKAQDIIKLNCVNDKLVQMKPMMNIVDQLHSEMRVAPTAGTLETLHSPVDSVHRLRSEAEQCIGESTLNSESSNSYAHPPIYDPTNDNPWGSTLEPPAFASPYN